MPLYVFTFVLCFFFLSLFHALISLFLIFDFMLHSSVCECLAKRAICIQMPLIFQMATPIAQRGRNAYTQLECVSHMIYTYISSSALVSCSSLIRLALPLPLSLYTHPSNARITITCFYAFKHFHSSNKHHH